MSYSANVHVAVYQVLDHVLTASAPPPGAKAAIHSIIDDLKIACAPREMVRQAESISLQLHHLETGLSRGDADKAADARQMLRSIAASWLNYRIAGSALSV
ncbi:MAG TPA: hypothetical protein VIV07_01320 [Sphingomicrobium sp.]